MMLWLNIFETRIFPGIEADVDEVLSEWETELAGQYRHLTIVNCYMKIKTNTRDREVIFG